MATTCRTASGDVLDTLCLNYYGHLNGTAEAVLDANQGLADEVSPYRAWMVIHLPDVVGRVRRGGCCGVNHRTRIARPYQNLARRNKCQ